MQSANNTNMNHAAQNKQPLNLLQRLEKRTSGGHTQDNAKKNLEA